MVCNGLLVCGVVWAEPLESPRYVAVLLCWFGFWVDG